MARHFDPSEVTFVAGGCSFTDENFDHRGVSNTKNWPYWLHERLNFKQKLNVGLGSAGNDYIAMKVMHTVQRLLDQGLDHSQILVCIMWSGDGRNCVYKEEPSINSEYNTNGWAENPVRIAGDKKWVLTNQHWQEPHTEDQWGEDTAKQIKYSRHPDVEKWRENQEVPGHPESQQANLLYDTATAQGINSLKHIIMCNNFLQLKGVRYYQTCAFRSGTVFSWIFGADADDWWQAHEQAEPENEHGKIELCLVGPYSDKDPRNHPELNWMLSQIDKDTLFSVVDMCSTYATPGCYSWRHPDSHESEAFVDNVIIPYLKKMEWLDADRIY